MKNKKKTGFLLAGVFAVSVLAITSVRLSVGAATSVNAYIVRRDNLSQTVELNGSLESERSKSSYAEADVCVKTVSVKIGDPVKKGDLLISFDEDQIAYQMALAEYEIQASDGTYKSTLESGSRTQALYHEATYNLSILDQQIADTEAAILAIENALMERKAELSAEGARLQVSILEKAGDPEEEEEYRNLQKLAQNNAYELQAGDDIVNMQEELNRLNGALAEYQTYKAEMVSQKAATTTSRMTSGQKAQLEATNAKILLTAEETIRNLTLAKEGIRAEFDGIVTALDVKEGMEVTRGMHLVTVASSEDIIVKCAANKYDIMSIAKDQTATTKVGTRSYQGKVTRIEGMTGIDANNASNVGVEIRLDEPDECLILGLDTKTTVNTASLENVICIPKDALVESQDGSYVFVVTDKKAVCKKIETGIKNDDMIEVTSGLQEGEIVVWNDETELKDGMDVKVNK
ncbi:MAG: efflux RND transporter periplasmic adaptor subunit [Lachnospiraceae bacterium]|nr:efflux RND transporter periplasmic adaptor subunit [Lachnospiraceae bacterium]